MSNLRVSPLRPLVLPSILLIGVVVLVALLEPLRTVDALVIGWVDSLPASMHGFFQIITDLGEVPVLIAVALVVALFELIQRRGRRALIMLLSLLALPTFYIIKETVRRARPVTEFVTSHGLHDFSFPSGHSTGSAAIYGMVAVILSSRFRRPWSGLLYAVMLILILLIGVSRVYLGAHFPTDVLGGWLVGFIVVSLLRSLSIRASPKVGDTTEATPAEAENIAR